jgi:DNA invertase Pin-like site-specific DNA recombinase
VVDQQRSAAIRAGLEAARARGRVGGRHGVPAKVRARIVRERAQGRSLRQIAAGLERDDIPTGHGGKRWYASSVRSIVHAASTSSSARESRR